MIHLEDVSKTSWRCLEDIFAWNFNNVLKASSRCFGKTSRRCLGDVLGRLIEGVLKTSWGLWPSGIYSDVLRTYDQCKYNCLDQDVWKLLKTKTIDFFRTASRLFHQDKCLLNAELLSRKMQRNQYLKPLQNRSALSSCDKWQEYILLLRNLGNDHCYRNYMMALPKPVIKLPSFF